MSMRRTKLEPVAASDGDEAKAVAAFKNLEWEQGEEAVKAEALAAYEALQDEATALFDRIASTLGSRERARSIFKRAIASGNRSAKGPRDPNMRRVLMELVRQLEASTPASEHKAIPRRLATMLAKNHPARWGSEPVSIEKRIRRAMAEPEPAPDK
jgi:hypothetical protein